MERRKLLMSVRTTLAEGEAEEEMSREIEKEEAWSLGKTEAVCSFQWRHSSRVRPRYL